MFVRLKSGLSTRDSIIRPLILRRWYLGVVALLLMLPFFYGAATSTGVYYSKMNVVFLPPPSKVGGNALKSEAVTTVMFAAIIERHFNGQGVVQQLRTVDAPLYGTGLRSGYSVYLPNSGGQWRMNFNDPVIVVEVVSPERATAESEMSRIVNQLEGLASAQQESLGIAADARITTETSPIQPTTQYVGNRKTRALGSLALLGAGLASASMVLGDKFINKLRNIRK